MPPTKGRELQMTSALRYSENQISRRNFLASGILIVPGLFSQVRAVQPTGVEFLSYEQVAPLIANCNFKLPKEFAERSKEDVRKAWPTWIQNQDREIHSRLLRGEEDSLVNFVLFGVSFTDQPRVMPSNSMSTEEATRLFQTRVQHFIAGILTPRDNERLLWLRNLIRQRGYSADTAEERKRLARYVLENISRYFEEQGRLRANLDRALNAVDDSTAFSARSELYQTRGLSIDTDFRPNYALEQALLELKKQKTLTKVRRVAIIGPGLDFADKNYGYDFYPLQTVQPFAVIESLLRLGLAQKSEIRMTVFDISSQTLSHLSRAIKLARLKRAYVIQLVLDRTRSWNPDVLEYWRRFGDRLGVSVDPIPSPPGIQEVDARAVRIDPGIVEMIEPRTVNCVLQHVNLPAGQRYDLIIATNVFIYYGAFEHALSLLNIGLMLARHGVFLSNDLLQACPGMPLQPRSHIAVKYSPKVNDGDWIEIYSQHE